MFCWQLISGKSFDWEPEFDKVVVAVKGFIWSSCSYLRKWLYSGHKSNIWHWYWQVKTIHHYKLLLVLYIHYYICEYLTCTWYGRSLVHWFVPEEYTEGASSMHKIGLYLFFICWSPVCRVNKPYLPIAAGDLSVKSAWYLVLFFAVAGVLVVGTNFGPFITALYCLGLLLGTIYSVPPFRMKRYPVVAFLIIATVWLIPFINLFFFFTEESLWMLPLMNDVLNVPVSYYSSNMHFTYSD